MSALPYGNPDTIPPISTNFEDSMTVSNKPENQRKKKMTVKPDEGRRNSLLTYLHRRFLGGTKGFTSGLRRYHVGSCPNLPQTMERSGQQMGNFLLPDRLPSKKSTKNDPNKLHVPNFFITSQTHTKEWKIQSSSSPDLGNKPKRPLIRKAMSVNSPYDTIRRDSRYYYRDEHVSQVLDFLYIGDINCAYNPFILCRLGIKRMVDISDTRPQEVPQHIKSLCSCTCRPETKHSRPKLYIDVSKHVQTDIGLYFQEINRFIESARLSKNNVLVHSYEGDNRAPCAVIQYLMAYYSMDLRTACTWVKKCRPGVRLSPDCMRALEAWDIRCVPSPEADLIITPDEEENDKKIAWTDC